MSVKMIEKQQVVMFSLIKRSMDSMIALIVVIVGPTVGTILFHLHRNLSSPLHPRTRC